MYSPRTHLIAGADPSFGIFEPPGVAVCINQKWIPHITGALELLAQPEYWGFTTTSSAQIDRLIERLAEEPDNCLLPSATWARCWDLTIAEQASQWEPLLYEGTIALFVPGVGYRVQQANQVIGHNIFLVLRFHNPAGAIKVNQARFFWSASGSGGASSTIGVLGPGLSPDLPAGFTITPSHALPWNGGDDTGLLSPEPTNSDYIIRMQIAGGVSDMISGEIILSDIQLFGSEGGPSGGQPC